MTTSNSSYRAFCSGAIALASPSGRMSKASLKRAQERIRIEIFGESGLQKGGEFQPSERKCLLRQAAQLRELAIRGMKPKAYLKKALELEQLASALEVE